MTLVAALSLTGGCSESDVGNGAAPLTEGCTDAERGTTLLSAENRFGFCGSECDFELTLQSCDSLGGCDFVALGVLNVSNNLMRTNRGTLSAMAQWGARSLVAAVADSTLDEVYGCPDCADGGASRVTLSRSGVTTTHWYEFGSPPQPLVEVDEFVQSLIEALDLCQSNDEVTLLPTCTPRAAR